MPQIIPAILVRDYENLKNEIALVRGLVSLAQIDICDGIFVPSLTWPFIGKNVLDEHFQKILREEEGIPFWEDIDFELDLMVSDAIQNFDIYTKLGAKGIIFHLEAVGDLKIFQEFLEGIDIYIKDNVDFGVAINPSTPTSNLQPFISHIDFVQFMGNDNIGHHGVPLDEKVYEKIKTLREKYPDLPISIDIGVNRDNISDLISAGATKLVMGSAIFGEGDIIRA